MSPVSSMIVSARIDPHTRQRQQPFIRRPELGMLQHLLLEPLDLLREQFDQIDLLGRHERQAVMLPEQLPLVPRR